MRSRKLNKTASASPHQPANATPPPTTPQRPKRLWLIAGGVALTIGIVAVILNWSRSTPPNNQPPPDEPPTLASSAAVPVLSTSPFHNTKPGVAYIGDQKCLECHTDYKSYHDHPMGRSLFESSEAPPLERFDQPVAFRSGPFQFQAFRRGEKQIHREWCADATGKVIAELQVEMAYTIGSGSQGRTYLYERDGFLFESPITWYAQKAKWDLSPGYEANPVHFTRRIDARCLFCHSHEVRPIEHTTNRYQQPPFGQLAIGCERCHGPGSLHAAESRPPSPPGEVDYTIVNPRRLTPVLRDAICEQCHLQGEATIPRRGRTLADYRPGLPLHEYLLVFVRPPELDEPTKIVGHVEQMRQSACSIKSNGQFGCTSCHDPHRVPAATEAVKFYEERCRSCHAPSKPPPPGKIVASDCALPLAKRIAGNGRTDCVACHMPRNPSASNQHLAVTDHRLLRRPDQPRLLRSGFQPGNIPLLPFHYRLLTPDDPDVSRDLALATVEIGGHAKRDGARQASDFLMQRALVLLDQAVLRDPSDIPALEARGLALYDQNRPDEALKVFDTVLAKAPDREQTLTWAAEAAMILGEFERAEVYCRKLTEKYPHYPIHFERLADLLIKRKAWKDALAAAEVAVRGNPFRVSARELLITVLLETGDQMRAKAEFDAVGVIDPASQGKLREKFGDRLRGIK